MTTTWTLTTKDLGRSVLLAENGDKLALEQESTTDDDEAVDTIALEQSEPGDVWQLSETRN